ncbi:hypothetical protein CHL74_14680 [Prevotella sp. 885]|nr:hypothetical protein CHL74_14680 [Prevotella sp. 885]
MIPTSNHNCSVILPNVVIVVYLLIPTSNHNYQHYGYFFALAVYLLIPASNHNVDRLCAFDEVLYIF